MGRIVEGGIGVSFSSRTVPSVYLDFVDPDGTEIDQDLTLRMVPLAFTVRVLPLGQRSPVQPYFGGGLGVINWRYSEIGEFIDFGAGNVIFRDTFVNERQQRRPGRRWVASASPATAASGGFEIRYQKATGDLGRRTSPRRRSTSAAGRTTSRSGVRF